MAQKKRFSLSFNFWILYLKLESLHNFFNVFLSKIYLKKKSGIKSFIE